MRLALCRSLCYPDLRKRQAIQQETRETAMTYEEAARRILPGIYRHFKGNAYQVIGVARHSETTEAVVVYRALYGEGGLWVRPAEMWNETVEQGGIRVPRFRRMDTEERITFYEQIYDELSSGQADMPDARRKLDILEDYYTSGRWRADYEADEAGKLPESLKRGVLSQDGVYNLLAEWQERRLEE